MKDEQDRIRAYQAKLGKYPRPCVTADVIAVRPAYSESQEGDWRKNPQFSLEILLVKRGNWPHEGKWALPGGFVQPDETVEDGALRELREETALKVQSLIPIGVFSKPGRDPRAWIMSNAFAAFCRRGDGKTVKPGDDAAAAKWFRIEFPTILGGRFTLPFYEDGQAAFTLSGSYVEEELTGGKVKRVDANPLAFDHAEIIATAFLRMLAYDLKKLAFFFLPEEFTLTDYIDIYQYLTRYSIAPGNIPSFRRQLTETQNPLLVPSGNIESANGKGHPRGKLYRRNVK